MTPHRRTFGRLLLASLALAAAGPAPLAAAAVDRPPKDFFGEYEGESISETEDGLSARDLSVKIEPWRGQGFTVDWTTVIHAAGGTRRQSYSIDFQPSPRAGIYGSAMRKDLFGGKAPLDPLKGEPYVWARIDGDTLTVYSLLITEEGGYEIQEFDRTLTEGGMRLDFTRIRDGEKLRTIKGTLKRVRS
jgi:hypothetical protein